MISGHCITAAVRGIHKRGIRMNSKKKVIIAVCVLFVIAILNGVGCANKTVSDSTDTESIEEAESREETETQGQKQAANTKKEIDTSVDSDSQKSTEITTSEVDGMRVTLESSLFSEELRLTVEFPTETENETGNKTEDEAESGAGDEQDQAPSFGGSLGTALGLELFKSMMHLDEFAEKYEDFKYSTNTSSDSGSSIVCDFTKDIQKDIVQYYKDAVTSAVEDQSKKLEYSGAEIDDGFKEIKILTDADAFDKNTMLLSDDRMMYDIMYDSVMARIYIGSLESKIGILFADEKTGTVLYKYNRDDLQTAEKEAMHGLDESVDVSVEKNSDGTSTVYYYAKNAYGFYDLESIAADMELDHPYENEDFSDYQYEIDNEHSIIAVTCNDSDREVIAQYQLSRIDFIPDSNECFRTEDLDASVPVYAGMEHSEDYSKINILTKDDGLTELTASWYPQAAEEARRYYNYWQILKGIPASQRIDPEVVYVDIDSGEVLYTHEF